MRKLIYLVLTVLIIACSSDDNNESMTQPLKKLSLADNGRFFITNQRSSVVLHGVNLVNKKEPYTYQNIGIGEEDIKLIRDLGLNVVRLGISWVGIEKVPNVYDEQYMNKIFQTVKMLIDNQIYVLIDLHQDAYAKKHGGFGMPDWSALGKGKMDPIGFPINEFGGLDRPKGSPGSGKISTVIDVDFDSFWGNLPFKGKGIQEKYLDMLEFVVKQIKAQPESIQNGIVGLEIMNEPFPGVGWTACTDGTLLEDGALNFQKGCKDFDIEKLTLFYKKAIRKIRSVDQTIMIWVDPVNLFGLGAPSFLDFKEMEDSKNLLVFSWHNYFTLDFLKPFENVEKIHKKYPERIGSMMTEFGANDNITVWESILPLADKYKTSWIYWTYANNPQFAFSDTGGTIPSDPKLQGIVYDPALELNDQITDKNGDKRRNVSKAIAGAITRPYPELTPGKPLSWAYKPEKKYFEYTYKYEDDSGFILSIVTPIRCFPNGYKATVTYLNNNEVLKKASFSQSEANFSLSHLKTDIEEEWEMTRNKFLIKPSEGNVIKIVIEAE